MKLKDVKCFKDIYKIFDKKELEELSADVRKTLNSIANSQGGHIGSSLGVVELTIALICFFNVEDSIFLFDTGHQSHVYKLFTNRKDTFNTLLKFNGLSNFQEMKESEYDWISNGHSGTSLGYAYAYSLSNSKKNIISIIGDASFYGSYTNQGLINLINSPHKTITIINDNDQSIGNNYISIKNMKQYCNSLGFDYIECSDGHDFTKLFASIKNANDSEKHVILHIKTAKAKGYDGVKLLDWNHTIKENTDFSYQKEIANLIEEIFDNNSVLLCPAMLNTSMFDNLKKKWPDNVIDCGINEELCALIASGFAKTGKKVYISIYSTFFQRIFDQLVHDIVRNNLSIVFLIDRAGLSYSGGVSHHGIYDVGLAKFFNNNIIFHPFTKKDIEDIKFIIKNNENTKKQIFIRYDKAKLTNINSKLTNYDYIWEELIFASKNNKTLITYGTNLQDFYKLVNEKNLNINLINARFINPIDKEMLEKHKNNKLYVYEHIIGNNNLYLDVYKYYKNEKKDIVSFNIKDPLIGHGSKNDVLKEQNLNFEQILKIINDD
ncbi:1-deoxy-D-xylulose-5-phosphate synthase N-terminal domain-containing protein [Spiroplasma tabanidicola]|uniref:1-deoxy-D-xylulose-5-phosphate synthase n=1 Tax=Spiroplasma tabanidicola TaxID=324079 RepID=A0A6I6C530_9MOLU|nr:1-deoxy-D-xylulose-5-phosphate synthase N-terminal domain-containing protein [Spiroplasma tabanidicola]QGS51947.1 1-deoxy-D-xylulose-5-phosphate synthase [Spiroplasma tabanidicola]